MAYSYRHKVLIDSRDVDGRGHCKASALLGHMQEAATQAAECSDFSRERLLQAYNGFWMMTRVWYRLDRPLKWEEELTIHTWHRGGKSAVSYRDCDLLVDGRRVGEGVAAWVLADRDSRKLIRLSRITEMSDSDGGELCKTITLNKLRRPEQLREVERRTMRYSDTDINGHVNNTRYADFACDAVRLDRLEEGRFLSGLQIGYLAECRPGEQLSLRAGEREESQYVCGMDEEGKTRFEAALFFGDVLP